MRVCACVCDCDLLFPLSHWVVLARRLFTTVAWQQGPHVPHTTASFVSVTQYLSTLCFSLCYSSKITCPRSLLYKCLSWDLTAVYVGGKITRRTFQVYGGACTPGSSVSAGRRVVSLIFHNDNNWSRLSTRSYLLNTFISVSTVALGGDCSPDMDSFFHPFVYFTTVTLFALCICIHQEIWTLVGKVLLQLRRAVGLTTVVKTTQEGDRMSVVVRMVCCWASG